MTPPAWRLGSFFLGGFECSTHLTLEGTRLDLITTTQHDVQAAEDYALCRAAGLCAVREAVRWPFVDRGGVLDLGEVRRLARLGRVTGLVQVWDLMHYGYPDDLDPLAPAYPARFAAYAGAVARIVREETAGPAYYTPVNEISYTAWAGGEVGYMAPFLHGQGGAYKRALVRAAIAGANAIWAADPAATMITVDPLVRQHIPPGRPDLQAEVDRFNTFWVTEAFDLLAGRLEPELGGSRAHLGILGFNYYAGNQWTLATPEEPQHFLFWDNPAATPLSDLLAELEARYGGPLLIAETGAAGESRAPWLAYLVAEAQAARARGVDLQGICLYPVITSPDWDDPTAFFDGGLFDVVPEPDGRLRRVIAEPVAAVLRAAQAALDPAHVPTAPLPAAPPPPAAGPIQWAALPDRVRFKAENFSYETLFAGESLVVEVYGLGPGAVVAPHRHPGTAHVLTVVAGAADVTLAGETVRLAAGSTVFVPAGQYHSIHNPTAARLIVQQVSAPPPWDARFGGPHPPT